MTAKPSDAAGPAGHVDRSHAERWASAAESYRLFVPEVTPEKMASSFARRLGPLGTFAFEAVGDMWNRPQLSRRDRSLLIISTLAAQSRDEELVVHTKIGLRHGLTRIEIEEILPMLVAYAGFPAAMAAARHVDEGLRQAEEVERLSPREGHEPKDDPQRDADGSSVLAALEGRADNDPAADLAEMRGRLGYLGELTMRWAMGEIWARPQLSGRDRSIVAISMLVSLGAERALATHIEGGLNFGLTADEIEEIITHLGLYAGLPKATDALLVAKPILEARS